MPTRLLPALVLAAALGACQAPPPGASGALASAFRLAPEGAPVAGPPAVTVSGTPVEGKATLTVHVDAVLRARRLLAAGSAVGRVEVTVSGPALQTTRTLFLTRAQLDAGTSSLTFTGLPEGELTIRILALSADGTRLGWETLTATVAEDAPATVTSAIAVTRAGGTTPVTVTGTTRRRGGGSSSGGGSAPVAEEEEAEEDDTGTGPASLTAGIALDPNTPVIVPPVLATHFLGVPGDDVGELALGADGTVWANTSFRYVREPGATGLVDWKGTPYRLPAGGAPVAVPGAAHRLTGLLAGGTEAFMRTGAFGFDVRTGSGAAALQAPVDYPLHDMDVAPDGSVWGVPDPAAYPLKRYDAIVKLDPATRTVLAPAWKAMPNPALVPFRIRIDAAGKLWVLLALQGFLDYGRPDVISAWLDPVTRTSSLTTEGMPLGVTDLARDSQRAIWTISPYRTTVHKLGPDGLPVVSTSLPVPADRLYIDAQDRVWAYDGTHEDFRTETPNPEARSPLLMRLSSRGGIEAYYHVGRDVDITKLLVTGNVMWVGTRAHGLLKLQL